MGRHRLEARLGKLSQRQMLLVVLGWRRQGLKGWRHPGEVVLEQVLQVWEQDMSATDEALSGLRGMGYWLARGREGRSWLTSL